MSDTVFKAGDVVQLKSGGPAMTVGEIRFDGWVSCTWFDGGKDKSRYFEPELLQIYNPPAPTGRLNRL